MESNPLHLQQHLSHNAQQFTLFTQQTTLHQFAITQSALSKQRQRRKTTQQSGQLLAPTATGNTRKRKSTTTKPPPLEGQVFYLDLQGPALQSAPRVVQTLQLLGAKVEPFFNVQTVTHIISNRDTAVPVPVVPQIETIRGISTSSPRKKRVEKLVSVGKEKTVPQEDIISLAKRTNKQVWQWQDFLAWLGSQPEPLVLTVEDVSGTCKPWRKEFSSDPKSKDSIPRLHFNPEYRTISPFVLPEVNLTAICAYI